MSIKIHTTGKEESKYSESRRKMQCGRVFDYLERWVGEGRCPDLSLELHIDHKTALCGSLEQQAGLFKTMHNERQWRAFQALLQPRAHTRVMKACQLSVYHSDTSQLFSTAGAQPRGMRPAQRHDWPRCALHETLLTTTRNPPSTLPRPGHGTHHSNGHTETEKRGETRRVHS